MTDISLAEAKLRLDALMVRVQSGEEVRIMRNGRPIARLSGIGSARDRSLKPIDFDALSAFAAQVATQPLPAGDFVRRMRDGDRY